MKKRTKTFTKTCNLVLSVAITLTLVACNPTPSDASKQSSTESPTLSTLAPSDLTTSEILSSNTETSSKEDTPQNSSVENDSQINSAASSKQESNSTVSSDEKESEPAWEYKNGGDNFIIKTNGKTKIKIPIDTKRFNTPKDTDTTEHTVEITRTAIQEIDGWIYFHEIYMCNSSYHSNAPNVDASGITTEKIMGYYRIKEDGSSFEQISETAAKNTDGMPLTCLRVLGYDGADMYFLRGESYQMGGPICKITLKENVEYFIDNATVFDCFYCIPKTSYIENGKIYMFDMIMSDTKDAVITIDDLKIKKETNVDTGKNTSSTKEETHKHSYTKKVVKPTCTKAGYTLHTCKCGETYKDNEKAKLGHNYENWEEIKKATTETTGLKKRKCNRCGYTSSKTLPKKEFEKFTKELNVYKNKNIEITPDSGDYYAYLSVYTTTKNTKQIEKFKEVFKTKFGFVPTASIECENVGVFIVDGYDEPQTIYHYYINDNTYPLLDHALYDVYHQICTDGVSHWVGFAIEGGFDDDWGELMSTSKVQTLKKEMYKLFYEKTGYSKKYIDAHDDDFVMGGVSQAGTMRTTDGRLIDILYILCREK